MTQTEAKKAFGTDRVVGQTLTVISRGVKRDFKITGVIKDMPKNSSMKFNAIMRLDFRRFNADNPNFLTNAGAASRGWVYLKLKPGTDPQADRGADCPPGRSATSPTSQWRRHATIAGDDEDWHFVNVHDVHLGKAQNGAMTPGNDRATITTFAIIALLILGMAVVNFTNLATARASQRAREVALRKVLGATRKQLIVQFIGESILIAAVVDAARAGACRAAGEAVRRLSRCRHHAQLFRRGRRAPAGRRAGTAGGDPGRALSGLLPVALPAGAGAESQQVRGRNAGFRPLRQASSCCSSRFRSASSSARR